LHVGEDNGDVVEHFERHAHEKAVPANDCDAGYRPDIVPLKDTALGNALPIPAQEAEDIRHEASGVQTAIRAVLVSASALVEVLATDVGAYDQADAHQAEQDPFAPQSETFGGVFFFFSFFSL
jgi:hypothetical protein